MWRTCNENNRDERFSSIQEPLGVYAGVSAMPPTIVLQDDERSPNYLVPPTSTTLPYNTYVVPTTSAGAWAGKDGQLATFNPATSTWQFNTYEDTNAQITETTENGSINIIPPLVTGTKFWVYNQFYWSTLIEMPSGPHIIGPVTLF